MSQQINFQSNDHDVIKPVSHHILQPINNYILKPMRFLHQKNEPSYIQAPEPELGDNSPGKAPTARGHFLGNLFINCQRVKLKSSAF